MGNIQRDTFLIGICIQYPERTLLLSFSILCAYGYSDVNVHLVIYCNSKSCFLCTKNFFLLSFSDITSLLLINICYFLNHICVLKKHYVLFTTLLFVVITHIFADITSFSRHLLFFHKLIILLAFVIISTYRSRILHTFQFL